MQIFHPGGRNPNTELVLAASQDTRQQQTESDAESGLAPECIHLGCGCSKWHCSDCTGGLPSLNWKLFLKQFFFSFLCHCLKSLIFDYSISSSRELRMLQTFGEKKFLFPDL